MRGGKIPCFRVGKRWRFKRSVLEQWIAQTSQVTTGSVDLEKREQEATVDKRERKTRRSEDKTQISFDLGLGGLFKGLGSLLELANELAEQAPTEVRREGHVGPIGAKSLPVGPTEPAMNVGNPAISRASLSACPRCLPALAASCRRNRHAPR